MADVIIFGTRDFASLAHFYLREDSEHEVVAFCSHRDYLPESREFEGLPVIALEDVKRSHPPSEFSFFAPMSHSEMNQRRKEVYREIKRLGYPLISYVSSRATNFARRIGENCFILEDNTLQPFLEIGDNVMIWSGNHLGHHSVIEDHAFFTSHVVLSGHCKAGRFSFFGVNSTVRDGVSIAEGTLVAMAACITANTEPWRIYKGLPAKDSGPSGDPR